MKEKTYYLAYENDDLIASFEGYEDNPQIKILLNLCNSNNLTVKIVSKSKHKEEQIKAEEKALKRLLSK